MRNDSGEVRRLNEFLRSCDRYSSLVEQQHQEGLDVSESQRRLDAWRCLYRDALSVASAAAVVEHAAYAAGSRPRR